MTDKGSKISDNPSVQELANVMPAVKAAKFLTGTLKAIGFSGEKVEGIDKAASDILKQFEVLSLPDQFNDAFSDQGWIAINSLSVDVMQEALNHLAAGDQGAAEETILGWFSEDTINLFAIKRSKSFNKANERWAQLKEALALTMEERYMAAVPLILIACDGFASDVLGKSPFEKNADLTSFDSIVGHPTSLPSLVRKLTKGVRKSSDEELTLPLRHGILHGRSLGYANKAVCYKAWMLMIALVDWAFDVREEEERKKKQDELENFSWKERDGQRRKLDKDREAIDAFQEIEWLPPFNEELDPELPVFAVFDFLEAWKNKNYGAMAKRAVNMTRMTHGHLSGRMRNDAEFVELLKYELKSVIQFSVVGAEARIFMQGKTPSGMVQGEFAVLEFRHTLDGDIAMPTDKGHWVVQQGCIFDLMHERTVEDYQPKAGE